MCNHIHLLLEVPPMAEGGISDAELLKRLKAIHSEAFVAEVGKELAEARKQGLEFRIAEIHERFNYRMHDLAQFMKGLLQRYTQWHNRTHSRTGTLWEDRFKSVIVEDGVAAKTIAAYIDFPSSTTAGWERPSAIDVPIHRLSGGAATCERASITAVIAAGCSASGTTAPSTRQP
jgi:putative transposase